MTAHHAGEFSSALALSAILVDGPQRALYTRLITFLAVISIGVWGLVLISTVIRIRSRRQYRMRIQRKLSV
jgi:hypothetical protein